MLDNKLLWRKQRHEIPDISLKIIACASWIPSRIDTNLGSTVVEKSIIFIKQISNNAYFAFYKIFQILKGRT